MISLATFLILFQNVLSIYLYVGNNLNSQDGSITHPFYSINNAIQNSINIEEIESNIIILDNLFGNTINTNINLEKGKTLKIM